MSRQRWNAQLIPYEAVFDLDTEQLKCVELTEQQIGLLLSQTTYLYWSTRYAKDNGERLTAEQKAVIQKAAAALEAVLVNAEGCEDVSYTIELDGCDLVLKNNGVTVSAVDLSDCISPPIHLAFDQVNCRFMYTQGDIYSPYTGGDWNSMIDFSMEGLRQCLVPPQQPAPMDMLPTTICDVATGAAELILADVHFVAAAIFAGLSTPPYPLAIDIIADVSFQVRDFWDALGLSQYITFAPTPDEPMLETLESLEARVLLAQKLYCSMSLDINGNIFFDGAEWQERMNDGFFSVNVRDAVLAWITQNGRGDLLRHYFETAALTVTGSDCSTFDCYATGTCADYTDLMVSGLGERTRLFDAAHAWGQGFGTAPQNSGDLEAGIGVSGGYGLRCNVAVASGQRGGGLFVDLGLECDILSVSINFRGTYTGGNLGGLHVRLRDENGTVLYHQQTTAPRNIAFAAYTVTAPVGFPFQDVRYVSWDIVTGSTVGNEAILAKPVIDVV